MSFYKTEPPDPDIWDDPTPHHSERTAYTCHSCHKPLVDRTTFKFFNGWPWCLDPCYREVAALYMAQPELEPEEIDQFNRRRR